LGKGQATWLGWLGKAGKGPGSEAPMACASRSQSQSLKRAAAVTVSGSVCFGQGCSSRPQKQTSFIQ